MLYFIFLTISTSMVLPVYGYMENKGMKWSPKAVSTRGLPSLPQYQWLTQQDRRIEYTRVFSQWSAGV